jgi:hypothetical protein
MISYEIEKKQLEQKQIIVLTQIENNMSTLKI